MKWDVRFLRLAREVSTWSKDGTGVGAVVADPKHRVVGLGYNGFPSGIEDNERLKDRMVEIEPLGVDDFQKRSSVIGLSAAGSESLARTASVLARGEGLEAHARAAEARIKGLDHNE